MNVAKFLLAVGSVPLALALCWPSTALADWAYTHWGMTPEQVVAASAGTAKVLPPAKRTRYEDDYWELAAEGTYTDEALKLSVAFTFDTRTGGLKCVMYNVFGDEVEAHRLVLLKRYGKPARESSFDTARMFTWHTPDVIEMGIGQRPVAAAVTHCMPMAK